MKTGLIGYGHMGREVESILLSRGHEIAFIIDENNLSDRNTAVISRADVVIEFTHPEAAYINIEACLKAGVPVVSGTTGWLARFEEICSLCNTLGGGLFYASNFSIGVNLFFELNNQLASLMNGYAGYSAHMEEIHHNRKKDAPSGTALTLANQIEAGIERITGWSGDLIPLPDKIAMTSIREGNVTGIHSVSYISDEDKISIRHEAFSRKSFAAGAVTAAEFMVGRTGIYSMKDLLTIRKSK
jgi:4-hydroxy-tetrahydrodipicolinate reductase